VFQARSVRGRIALPTATIKRGAYKPRERPLTVEEIITITRLRAQAITWVVIAPKFGRDPQKLQKTWSTYPDQWANDVRLPTDVRAFHMERSKRIEDHDETEIPRRPNLDHIYSTACVAGGGFPVLRLPPIDSLDLAALRAKRLAGLVR
jgi:hypothetical protein